MLLNFGHTLAHTIEQYYHYERESHGEAVAIGMYQLTKLAEEKGLTIYGLPSSCGVALGALTEAIALDKKNLNNHLNLILLHGIGDSYIYPAALDFFDDTERIV